MDGFDEYVRLKKIERGLDPETGEPLREKGKNRISTFIFCTREGTKIKVPGQAYPNQ